ncbi:MAG: conjugal transfer protein TrbF [Asticcacaulis sp.]|uniref:conjugal transfer protein TrbF n=1 Tax=Asticcacaulis sp. TaxID=1872648 RepID=UPI0039E2B874
MFKRSIQRYGVTPEPATPYQRAGQVWDQRIGSAIAQAANWRALAFGAVAVSGLLAAGLIYQGSQSRVTPYVVAVGPGEGVRAVGPAAPEITPSDAQIAWFLSRFITDVRSLPTDPVLARQNWLEAYVFATEDAGRFLNEQARLADPLADAGKRSVTVNIASAVRASSNSFQVKWVEQTFDAGTLVSTTRWTALLGIRQKTPTTADVLRKNPLGLYVTRLAWSKDYAGDLPAPVRSSVPVSSQP